MFKKVFLALLIPLLFLLSSCTKHSHIDANTWLPTVIREGEQPETSDAPMGTNIAHQQLTQQSPTGIQEQLWQFLDWLEWMSVWDTKISVPWARAVFTSDTEAAVMAGDERVHLHPSYDGSLHIAIPDAMMAANIIALGRWEAHPRNPATLMLYGPRDESELRIIEQIIATVYELHEIH